MQVSTEAKQSESADEILMLDNWGITMPEMHEHYKNVFIYEAGFIRIFASTYHVFIFSLKPL